MHLVAMTSRHSEDKTSKRVEFPRRGGETSFCPLRREEKSINVGDATSYSLPRRIIQVVPKPFFTCARVRLPARSHLRSTLPRPFTASRSRLAAYSPLNLSFERVTQFRSRRTSTRGRIGMASRAIAGGMCAIFSTEERANSP